LAHSTAYLRLNGQPHQPFLRTDAITWRVVTASTHGRRRFENCQQLPWRATSQRVLLKAHRQRQRRRLLRRFPKECCPVNCQGQGSSSCNSTHVNETCTWVRNGVRPASKQWREGKGELTLKTSATVHCCCDCQADDPRHRPPFDRSRKNYCPRAQSKSWQA